MPHKKWLVGIVGTGNVANDSYLPYLSKRDDVEFVYASRNFERAKKTAEKFGGRAFDNIAKMMEVHPDVVLVLTGEAYHLDVADEVLKCGGISRLFIEKPLHARNGQDNVTEQDFSEACEFMRRANAAGVSVAMNFNYRFFELTRKLREIVSARNFGELRESSWFVNYACWSHCIDLLHCFGGGVAEVAALNAQGKGGDLVGAFITENGGAGTILGTNASSFMLPLYHVTLNFERASVTFADLDSELKIYSNDSDYCESYHLISDKSRWLKYNNSFASSLAAYFDTIGKDLPPPVTGVDGLRELQFEAALRRSAATGKKVVITAELPINL